MNRAYGMQNRTILLVRLQTQKADFRGIGVLVDLFYKLGKQLNWVDLK